MIYSDLVSAIAAWLNKVEVEQSIPSFIRLAEAQISRRLAEAGVSSARERATATLDSEYAAAPANFAGLIGARRVTGEPIENITLASMETLKTSRPEDKGPPRYVSYIGGETPLRFWPIPDGAYTVELIFQATPEPLGPDEATNWVLANHPDVYLYGALTQSAPFLGDDARLSTWGSLYDAATDAMIAAETAKRGSQNTPGFRADMPHRECLS